MDNAIQALVMLLGGGVLGSITNTIVGQVNKSREAKVTQRRVEIDRAAAAERDTRILKESLAVHRRIIIDAPCLGPADLPEWPATTSHTTKGGS